MHDMMMHDMTEGNSCMGKLALQCRAQFIAQLTPRKRKGQDQTHVHAITLQV